MHLYLEEQQCISTWRSCSLSPISPSSLIFSLMASSTDFWLPTGEPRISAWSISTTWRPGAALNIRSPVPGSSQISSDLARFSCRPKAAASFPTNLRSQGTSSRLPPRVQSSKTFNSDRSFSSIGEIVKQNSRGLGGGALLDALERMDDVVFAKEVGWLGVCGVDKLQKLWCGFLHCHENSIVSYAVECILKVKLQ